MKKIKRCVLGAVFLIFVVFMVGRGARAAGLEADMVIYNGKILTADSPDPRTFTIAQAAAIYDGKFVAVGGNDEVLQYAGPQTKKIDLGGRTVLPGLVETHHHIYSYANHFFPKDQPKPGETDPGTPLTWTNKADFLAQIRSLALKKKPGEWIVSQPRGGGAMGLVPEIFRGDITKAELDEVAPNNPVVIYWQDATQAQVSTKAVELLLERYPKMIGVRRDANGVPTGRLAGAASETLWHEYFPVVPPEQLAPYYKMEMEEIAAQGMTTVSTKLLPNDLAAYFWIHARGELPTRMAYTSQALTGSVNVEAMARRLYGLQGGAGANMWGQGDDKLWMIGITHISGDSVTGTGGACVSKEYPREALNYPLWRYQFFGPRGICRLDDPDFAADLELLRVAAKYGFRISALHLAGDRAVDRYLTELEQLSKQYPDIAQRRWASDHCQMVGEKEVKRAKPLNLFFSCSPKYLHDGERGGMGAMKLVFGEEEAGNLVIPLRSMIDNGVRAVMELDSHGFYPFLALEVAVTRKDINGKVWGPQQRINRRESLYMYTRWAAEYVLRENQLGSIEPKKYADFVVLDRDYLTVPEDEIGEIDPVLTVMGGKPTYTQPDFGKSVGLPTFGYQGSRSNWTRGTPADLQRRGSWN